MSSSLKRSGVFIAAAFVGLVACSDHNTGVAPPEFRLADASGFADTTLIDGFYFQPPMVPTPEFDGTFNPGLRPSVTVHGPFELRQVDTSAAGTPILDTYPDDHPLAASCSASTLFADGFDVTESLDQQVYSTSWQPRVKGGKPGTQVTPDKGYRICVTSEGFVDGQITTRLLGYRDVKPEESNDDNRSTAQTPVYEFKVGSNLPIKFRIEVGALGCYTQEGEIVDCTETYIDPTGGTAICENSTCSLQVPPGALDSGGFFTIQRIENDECNESIDVDPTFIDMALPQFPGCVRVTTNAAVADPDTSNLIIVGACITLTDSAGNLIPSLQKLTDENGLLRSDMISRLQLHHQRSTDGKIEALPNFPSVIDNACDQQLHDFFDSQASSGVLGRLASATRGIRRVVAPWTAPKRAFAADRGFGGGFGGAFSPFVWAMPAKMDGFRFEDPIDTPWVNNEDGTSGGTIVPVVQLTNSVDACLESACPNGPEALPVPGAEVTFEVASAADGQLYDDVTGTYGSTVVRRTDKAGRVAVPWLLPEDPGEYTVNAYGLGIGVDQEFAVHYSNGTDPGIRELGTPTLPFVAATCSDKTSLLKETGVETVGDPSADGSFYENSADIPINISGSDADTATLYWTTDCFNTYFALAIPAAEDLQNSLRIVFAESLPATPNADGFYETVPQPGNDDMWTIFRDKLGAWQIEDWHVSLDCKGNKQSECGVADTDAGGSNDLLTPFDVFGGVYPDVAVSELEGTTYFEFAKAFTSDSAAGALGDLDIPTPAVGGSVDVGFYLAVQMGKGAQGNTEWPDFRVFKKITIDRK
jgi:hypothetical protein